VFYYLIIYYCRKWECSV